MWLARQKKKNQAPYVPRAYLQQVPFKKSCSTGSSPWIGDGARNSEGARSSRSFVCFLFQDVQILLPATCYKKKLLDNQ